MNQDIEMENLREQLSQKRINEFVSSLLNTEDLDAQRHHLICLVSRALTELRDTEREMITAYLREMTDSICPGCLMAHTKDVNNLESVATLFNNYLSAEGCDA